MNIEEQAKKYATTIVKGHKQWEQVDQVKRDAFIAGYQSQQLSWVNAAWVLGEFIWKNDYPEIYEFRKDGSRFADQDALLKYLMDFFRWIKDHPQSKLQSPPIESEREVCVAGCKHFTGGEIKHHPDCPFYPESLSKIYDDKDKEIQRLKEENEGLESEIRITESQLIIANQEIDRLKELLRSQVVGRKDDFLWDNGVVGNEDELRKKLDSEWR